MGNHIKVAVRNSILTLYERGWSRRKIARELGIDRETVGRHLRIWQEGSKPANPTAGNLAISGSKPANPTAGNLAISGSKPANLTAGNYGPQSLCAPYREELERKFAQGLSAQRAFQDLRGETGFMGSYEAVKRFYRRLKQVRPERVYRIESPPGEEAQVDFGRGARILEGDGGKRFPHVLRVILSYSRKGYSECLPRQTTEAFIRALENAFRSFGGVPRTVSLDNLKAAVTNADWFDPDLNPKVEEFARYYGTAFLPTRPYTPQDKGKIESGIKYVKNNGLKARVFSSIQGENEFLREWERTVADCRIHGTTRKQVGKVFAEEEKRALLPLPAMIFPCFEEGERTVHRDGYVEVARAYYEVPEEYIRRRVWVRWDSRLVRIYNRRFEQIAVFARLLPGRFSGCLSTRGRRGSMEETTEYWLDRATLIGEQAGKWAAGVIGSRGPQGIRVLMGLLSLSRKHTGGKIEQACEQAVRHGAYRLRDLRRLLEAPSRQETFAFLETHPLIRDISEYGAFLRKAQTHKAVNEAKEAVGHE